MFEKISINNFKMMKKIKHNKYKNNKNYYWTLNQILNLQHYYLSKIKINKKNKIQNNNNPIVQFNKINN